MLSYSTLAYVSLFTLNMVNLLSLSCDIVDLKHDFYQF